MNASMSFSDFHSYFILTISHLYTSVNDYSIFLCFAHLKFPFLVILHNHFLTYSSIIFRATCIQVCFFHLFPTTSMNLSPLSLPRPLFFYVFLSIFSKKRLYFSNYRFILSIQEDNFEYLYSNFSSFYGGLLCIQRNTPALQKLCTGN